MAIGGPGLYQNDIGDDIKALYPDRLRRGKTSAEITAELMELYREALADPDDAVAFWLALADIEWEHGRLLPDVQSKALMYLESGGDLPRWQRESPRHARKRRAVLDKLLAKLQTPQPPEKKIPRYRLYQCRWENGDVFSFRLESDYARELDLYGRHLLIRKVDESLWHPGHITPVVYVKLTDGAELPASVEEYDKLEYVKIAATAYGLLSEYRVELITTSAKVIPPKLTYLGNFRDARPPVDEFVPHTKVNLTSIFWKDFEAALLKRYWGHNLRNYKIYLEQDEGISK